MNNKTGSTFVAEIILPDGVYWFQGIREQRLQSPDGKWHNIPHNLWTPYFTDALFIAGDEIEEIKETLKGAEGLKIVPLSESSHEQTAGVHYFGNLPIVCRTVKADTLKVGDFFKYGSTGVFHQVEEIFDEEIHFISIRGGSHSTMGAKSQTRVLIVKDGASIRLLEDIKARRIDPVK